MNETVVISLVYVGFSQPLYEGPKDGEAFDALTRTLQHAHEHPGILAVTVVHQEPGKQDRLNLFPFVDVKKLLKSN